MRRVLANVGCVVKFLKLLSVGIRNRIFNIYICVCMYVWMCT